MFPHRSTSSFTLVELLVVIGILAILTAAIVIILNPSELLKQGRDSTRMTDLANIQKAVQLLLSQNPAVNLGTASTVYVSLPDNSPTCSNLNLPALPPGYQYHCASSASSTLVNGQGWLPIDFTSSNVQNLSKLPVDPSNAPSVRLYYAYTPASNGTFEIASTLESSKYGLGGGANKVSTDGGQYAGLFEKGSNLLLLPTDYGDPSLVGYWSFDEGSGATTADRSGNDNAGMLHNNPVWQASSSCKRGSCLSFADASATNVDMANSSSLNTINATNRITVSAWIYQTSQSNYDRIITSNWATDRSWLLGVTYTPSYAPTFNVKIGGVQYNAAASSTSLNTWYHVAGVYDGNTVKIYVNGQLQNWIALSNADLDNGPYAMAISDGSFSEGFNGRLDEIRLYNRALSDAEILALYNATK
jgi:type II secretory pathway pseudopilin PulG